MLQEPRPHPAHTAGSGNSQFAGSRFFIEDVFPAVDGGRFPVKRIAGEAVDVWADIYRDGHDVLAASLTWRREGEDRPHVEPMTEPMTLHSNDRWHGVFVPPVPGRYSYAIETWTDLFGTWRKNFLLRRTAGTDTALDLDEGRELLVRACAPTAEAANIIDAALLAFETSRDVEMLLAEDVARAMSNAEPREDLAWSESYPLTADRSLARASAWYEIFPRSQSPVPGRHGTFQDCIARLPDIAELGFDVLYFPPIHPIGRTNRKGRNNALVARSGDPGSPYAIGAPEGGHDAIHPELGTLDDFRRLIAAAREQGLEIAIDFAIQCSPDHPWLKQHPEWFDWRADGSLRYAENPPKKYEDIVNPDFYGPSAKTLWIALREIVLFWVDQGVRIFRVDNPHTKPLPFWEWLIREVQDRDPGVIFLSEAFTRPKLMKALAKLGFTQSYTYFTWRTSKAEFSDYLSELTRYPEREYFRPNFFVNTPDILPYHLQGGERWMFRSRLALAATLSGNYGVYSGFELIEHVPVPGKEEYLNSEKYEIKTRDWHQAGNLRDDIMRINRIRRANPALLQTENLRFVAVDDDQVIGFVKESVAHDNAVAVAIALTGSRREFWFHFGHFEIGREGARAPVRAVENLITGETRYLEWGGLRLTIDPTRDPVLMFRCLA